MFQFPSFASSPYFTQMKIIDSYIYGVAPFGNVRVKACLAALRTLSWPTPSFVASYVPRHPSRAFCRLSYLSIINTEIKDPKIFYAVPRLYKYRPRTFI